MEEFKFIVMSIDPLEDEEDNLQKYCWSATGETEEEAKQKVIDEFERKGLPVYWIK